MPPFIQAFAETTARAPLVGRVRLRTLVSVRWFAVAGQASAILFVYFGLGHDFALAATLGAVGVSAVLNGVLMLDRPPAGRLDDRAAGAVLGYDVLQLATLLYFTGGLTNPFAVLLVAPVAVAASSLTRGSTVLLATLAVVAAGLLARWHDPLPGSAMTDGLPPVLAFGIWLALALTVVFVAAYVGRLAGEARQMSDALSAAQAALARENRMAAVGGLAAAAAHELGTPLATIAVVAKELAKDAPEGPVREDAELLLKEAMRCRDILARLAAKPEGGGPEGNPFPQPPLSVLLREIAARYARGGIVPQVSGDFADGYDPPTARAPELVQALGTLIENACQFAREKVAVRVWSDAGSVGVDVADDGPGFAPEIFARLGEPYISTRRDEGDHMGLGIFIATTLLSRSGGAVSCANAAGGGACVSVVWPRGAFPDAARSGRTT
ncbi:MAG: ActS/PrrB/RegB family redox-sensitive histidine kinase [Alphaproteobacteria bacterium]|nr:ActS/PrrB/RegB family redox-sensitive histidine kinase [Alphaproteobacteria bacterium]